MNEEKTITFAEFKAWLTGLIQGKGGALPDVADWKRIKQKMDQVVEQEQLPVSEPHHVYYPPVFQPRYDEPYPCSYPPNPGPHWTTSPIYNNHRVTSGVNVNLADTTTISSSVATSAIASVGRLSMTPEEVVEIYNRLHDDYSDPAQQQLNFGENDDSTKDS